jgi:hypothetical protein
MDKNRQLTISERDRRAIVLLARLTDKELFGLECYLAGTRAAGRTAERQEATKQPALAKV